MSDITPKPKRKARKNKRKGIRPSVRFEVFKRDKFTCQYCGRKAPDVILNADHIDPHAKGGSDDILNLITSCEECNSGKGDRVLSDDVAIHKARAQAEELEERRQQLEMMAEWQKSLLGIKEREVELICEHWNAQSGGHYITEYGAKELGKLLKKFSYSEVAEAINTAITHYCRTRSSDDAFDEAFSKVGGICRMNRVKRENPDIAQLHYCKGILRKRFSYLKPWAIMPELESAYSAGIPVEQLIEASKTACNWTNFLAEIDLIIGGNA